MAAPIPIAHQFLSGPFCSAEFVGAGYSEKVLRSRRFMRPYPRVWVSTSHEMTARDRRQAARLALPADARMTGITRIQELGLDFGDECPVHFVVDRDLHIDIAGITLHRTVEMPPADEDAVSPAAAFIAYCAEASVIDAIGVGDWLLHWHHMALSELGELIAMQPWRNGATEARCIFPRLTSRSRSVPESRLRVLMLASGITGLEVNAAFETPDGRPLEIDLLVRSLPFAIEYDGSHHQRDRSQYLKDIDRHAALREAGVHYEIVTKEHMRSPRALALMLHRRLVSRGYDGPPPDFGRRWQAVFEKIRPSAAPQR